MQIRELEQEDIGILAEWWEIRGSALPIDFLPPKGFGIWEGDNLICGGFIYEMDAAIGKVGMIGWICANPEFPLKVLLGVSTFLKNVKLYAKSKGYVGLMGTTNNPVLQHQYARCGFEEGDLNVNQYITFL